MEIKLEVPQEVFDKALEGTQKLSNYDYFYDVVEEDKELAKMVFKHFNGARLKDVKNFTQSLMKIADRYGDNKIVTDLGNDNVDVAIDDILNAKCNLMSAIKPEIEALFLKESQKLKQESKQSQNGEPKLQSNESLLDKCVLLLKFGKK